MYPSALAGGQVRWSRAVVEAVLPLRVDANTGGEIEEEEESELLCAGERVVRFGSGGGERVRWRRGRARNLERFTVSLGM